MWKVQLEKKQERGELMENFKYVNGKLYCEDVPVEKIVERVGTPVYIYSKSSIRTSLENFKFHLPEKTIVCYSLKANSNLNIIRFIAEQGTGADVVSGGELFLALKAGFTPQKIVFSGVGKTENEIEQGLKAGILFINAESMEEIDVIDQIAGTMGVKAPISIRVNPDVKLDNHHNYITTGFRENKFGLVEDEAFEAYLHARELKNIKIKGIHCHIGSQLLTLDPFREAFQKLKDFILKLKSAGINIQYSDFGGGLGIRYREEDSRVKIEEYAQLIKKVSEDTDTIPIVEPGRNIIGEAGILVGRVVYVKRTRFKNFLITDIGMNDLMRPSLYGSYHQIKPCFSNTKKEENIKWDVVGPICESGDFIGKGVELPILKRNDLIAVFSAGAYGYSMTSNYNSRTRPPEVLVKGNEFHIVRRRETYEDFLV